MKTNLLKMYVIGAAYALVLSACGGKSSHDHAHGDHTGHDHASEEASETAAADIKLSDGKYTELVEAYMNLKDALVASDKHLASLLAEELSTWLGEYAGGATADEMAVHAGHISES
jgi:major membrane immunogen (membrane-anchored lipoprotein)